jgi:hypothetical protein
MNGRTYQITVLNHDGTPAWSIKLPSVTTLLDGVLAKNGLEAWYYKQAVSGFSSLLSRYGAGVPSDIPSLHSLMKTEGLSPYSIRDEAADTGLKIHGAVETLAAGKKTKKFPELTLWWEAQGFGPKDILASEEIVVSFREGYAGTLDLVFNTEEGVTTLTDVKSGSLRYTHVLQLWAYKQAWEERGGRPAIERFSLLQVPRSGEPAVEYEIPMREEDKLAWEAVLQLHRAIPKRFDPKKGVFS